MSELPPLKPKQVIGGLIRLGELLSSHLSLETRMTALCREIVVVVNCDRSLIMIWDGDSYRAAYNWGHPPEMDDELESYRVAHDAPLMTQINESRSFVVVNDARSHPATRGIAERAQIESIVVAPLFNDVGGPLGFLTAEFNENVGEFDQQRAELVMGAARLAETTLIANRERQRARQSGTVQRQLLERLTTTEERERRRVSADIHDDPLQRLTSLMHGIELAAQATTDPDTKTALDALVDQSEAAAKSLRDLIQDVHPPSVDIGGLSGAVNTLLTRLGRKHDWQVEMKDLTTQDLSPTVASVLYRIVQQGLDNVARHASAGTVSITMESVAGSIEVILADDGSGFDPQAVPIDRFGLVSMEDRADFVGGALDVTSSPGEGTTVVITLPLDD